MVQYSDDKFDPGEPEAKYTNRRAEADRIYTELCEAPDMDWVAIYEHNVAVCVKNNTDHPVQLGYWARR